MPSGSISLSQFSLNVLKWIPATMHCSFRALLISYCQGFNSVKQKKGCVCLSVPICLLLLCSPAESNLFFHKGKYALTIRFLASQLENLYCGTAITSGLVDDLGCMSSIWSLAIFFCKLVRSPTTYLMKWLNI